MSYYLLPKNYNIINLNPYTSNFINNSFISFSLINYYINLKTQVIKMFENNETINLNNNIINQDINKKIEDALKIINPYDFIYNNIPGSNISVSKLREKKQLFYDYLEINNTLKLLENYNNINIKSLHISNDLDSIECIKMLRHNNENDIYYYFKTFENYEELILNKQKNLLFFNEYKYNLIYYETNLNNYILSFSQLMLIILKQQNLNGNIVIKIGDIFNKPVCDIIYFLTSLYENVYIIKPYTNNVISFDKYIICKNFLLNEKNIKYLKFNYYKLYVFLKKLKNENIGGLLNYEIPYYFKNKLDDFSISFTQKQIEALDLILNIYKNKNKNKIDMLIKNSIKKSINWCAKNNIPYNFIDNYDYKSLRL